MIESDSQLAAAHPECVDLLRMYHERAKENAAAAPTVLPIGSDMSACDSDAPAVAGTTGGWQARLSAPDDIPGSVWSARHGQLIAWGWLTFQLGEGRAGLQYRVTPEGRRLLSTNSNVAEAATEDAPAETLAAA